MSFILTPPDSTTTTTTTTTTNHYSNNNNNNNNKDNSSPKFLLHQRQHFPIINRHDNNNNNNIDNNNKNNEGVKQQISSSSSTTTTTTTTLVECTIITPNSLLPLEETANGKIQITVYHKNTNTKTENNDTDNNNDTNNNNYYNYYDDDGMYFLQLVKLGYYDRLYFFRVIQNFVAQFGYDHVHKLDDTTTKPKRRKQEKKEQQQDDKQENVVSLSNIRGTITLVAGNTGQVFINVGNNQRLDKEGSLPFGTIDSVGMGTVVDKIYTGYKQGSGQIQVLSKNKRSDTSSTTSATTTTVEEEMKQKFPNMSQIDTCRIIM